MSIGNGGFDHLRRIDPTGSTQNYEEHHDGRKRRKVSYKGRVWEESEEELPLIPQTFPVDNEEDTKNKYKKGSHVYADDLLLQKAEKLFEKFTTLEDKIAGIFFYETEAYYDSEVQKSVEEAILKWKIGGLLFTRGDYKRQLYLVERYQQLAQIPFLMGNDFVHSLTYYFRDDSMDEWGIDKMDVKYFCDLGKAAVFQNRRLGVHFQLAERRGGVEAFFAHFPLSEEQIKAFRKGIRDARGVIGLFGCEAKKFTSLALDKSNLLKPIFSGDFLFSGGEVKEVFSLKTLTFNDFSYLPLEECQEKLIAAFKSGSYDAFLFSLGQQTLISFVAECIREGKIEEKDLDKKLMKILILKSLF